MQSRANFSPANSLLTEKNTWKTTHSGVAPSTQVVTTAQVSQKNSALEVNPNRGRSGNEQGFLLP